MITNDSKSVIESEHFHMICPESMRYIICLKPFVSDEDLWRAVMKWARCKVLKYHSSARMNLDPFIKPRLIVPHFKHIDLCMLNLTKLVEKITMKESSSEEYLDLFSCYHSVVTNPCRNILVCTESDNETKYVVHEEFEVKVIYDSSYWFEPILSVSSQINITTKKSPITLYALVCSSKRPVDWDALQQAIDTLKVYEIECLVKTISVSNSKKTENENIVSEITFKDSVKYNEEFQIKLKSNDSLLKLEPNSEYKIEIAFSTPHPLWYTNEIEYFSPIESNLYVASGLINEEDMWYGTHVKCVLYRAEEP